MYSQRHDFFFFREICEEFGTFSGPVNENDFNFQLCLSGFRICRPRVSERDFKSKILLFHETCFNYECSLGDVAGVEIFS